MTYSLTLDTLAILIILFRSEFSTSLYKQYNTINDRIHERYIRTYCTTYCSVYVQCLQFYFYYDLYLITLMSGYMKIYKTDLSYRVCKMKKMLSNTHDDLVSCIILVLQQDLDQYKINNVVLNIFFFLESIFSMQIIDSITIFFNGIQANDK